MEYFNTDNFFGVRAYKDNNIIEIKIDNNKNFIEIKINNSIKTIDIIFIKNYITPNFTVEMFYYVLQNFLKYKNYKLINNKNYYTFEGFYKEDYDQSDIINIKFDV